jgi:hypothetical protein
MKNSRSLVHSRSPEINRVNKLSDHTSPARKTSKNGIEDKRRSSECLKILN